MTHSLCRAPVLFIFVQLFLLSRRVDNAPNNEAASKTGSTQTKNYRLVNKCPKFGAYCKCLTNTDQIPSIVTRFPPFRYESITDGTTLDQKVDEEIISNNKNVTPSSQNSNITKTSSFLPGEYTYLIILSCENGNNSMFDEKFGDLKVFKDFYHNLTKPPGDLKTANIETVLIFHKNSFGKLGFLVESSGLAKSEFDGLNMITHLVLLDNRLVNISQITFAPLFPNLEVVTIAEKTEPPKSQLEKTVIDNVFFGIVEAFQGELSKLVSLNLEISSKSLPQGIFRNLKAPRLKYFSFRSNSLNDLYDASFEGLSNDLTEAHIGGKRFKSIPWNALTHFRNIEVLSLDMELGNLSNTAIDPKVALKLPLCYAINFDNSYITNLTPNAFPPNLTIFQKLEGLNMARVSLENISANALSSLRQLQFLSLSENSLKNITREAFAGLGALKLLFLDHNKISTLQDSSDYAFAKSLVNLTLRSNQLTTFPVQFINSLTNIESLDLSQNQLNMTASKSLPTFANLSKLSRLDLSDNNLTVLPPEFISNLSDSLVVLDVSRNRLNELPKYLLNNFSRLTTLNLNDNNISHMDIAIVYDKMPTMSDSLTYIGLKGNPWYCDCKTQVLVSFIYNRFESMNFADVKRQTHELAESYCVAPARAKGKSLLSLIHANFCNVTNGTLAPTLNSPNPVGISKKPTMSPTSLTPSSKGDHQTSAGTSNQPKTLILNETLKDGKKVQVLYEDIPYVKNVNKLNKANHRTSRHGFGIVLGILTVIAFVIGVILVAIRHNLLSRVFKHSRNPLAFNLNNMRQTGMPLPFDRNFVYTKMNNNPTETA